MAVIDGDLRKIFRNKLKKGFHWQSIETGGTGLGIPDSNFCTLPAEWDRVAGAGREGWVEFKQTDGWAVTLSTEQVGWHKTRAMYGGVTFIAIRRWHDGGPRKGDAVDELWIYRGMYAGELKDSGLRCGVPCLGIYEGGPSGWCWRAVGDVLQGRIA